MMMEISFGSQLPFISEILRISNNVYCMAGLVSGSVRSLPTSDDSLGMTAPAMMTLSCSVQPFCVENLDRLVNSVIAPPNEVISMLPYHAFSLKKSGYPGLDIA